MFIARQPIFKKNKKVYGYELFFRESAQATKYTGGTAVSSTAQVLGNLYEHGIESIVGRDKAFVNFDAEFILSEAIFLIDPDTLIVEILENVKVDQTLILRLAHLKEKGFTIALDDFVMNENTTDLLKLADIIKWDILSTPLESLDELVIEALKYNKIILAEKVETQEQFDLAKTMGFHLFQGFFFSKPKIVGREGSHQSSKAHYSLILEELQKEEPSFARLAKIIETDVDLTYRLLRVSSQQKDKEIISSIQKALVLMGLRQLEHWISVLMLQDLAQNKPLELMRVSLIRSKFAEYIAKHSGYNKRREELFITGLFSMLDAILDSSMEDALKGIAISEDITKALIYSEGDFMPVGYLIFSYEKADWSNVSKYAAQVGIDEKILSEGYLKAIKWTSTVFERIYN